MIGAVALIALAALALRGHIPGAPAAEPDSGAAPSALTVAVMPVLLTVSVVVLIAGVVASHHRLPLSMPEPDEHEPLNLRWGRDGLIALAVLTGLGLLLAAVSALLLTRLGANTRSAPSVGPAPSGDQDPTGAPTIGPGTTTQLTGTELRVAIVAAVVLVAVACAGLVVVGVSARRKPVPGPPAEQPRRRTEQDTLARAAEMGLAAMAAPGQEPRAAIISCYVAMERGLAVDRAAAPKASDTPMEVLARAFASGRLHDDSARELVALFEEARFSPHAMLEWQRMRAEQLLRVVLADLQGAHPAGSAGAEAVTARVEAVTAGAGDAGAGTGGTGG
ncbi:MAG TPA: DUF4129 domain-containing protein [Nocardia sp.]|uniref:DUF4129 domain-containing protein n=1 Tax=Nocardia TaxID=1817 RepID=UPI002456086A|nr:MULTISPECIES: DUF4129 domain-containing protein [Nocardia]HLS77416.1 DUF4129 domain-containing protein [Nocardia sp.]